MDCSHDEKVSQQKHVQPPPEPPATMLRRAAAGRAAISERTTARDGTRGRRSRHRTRLRGARGVRSCEVVTEGNDGRAGGAPAAVARVGGGTGAPWRKRAAGRRAQGAWGGAPTVPDPRSSPGLFATRVEALLDNGCKNALGGTPCP